MNREMREEPFTGPGWGKPDREPELSVWRRVLAQVADDVRYVKDAG